MNILFDIKKVYILSAISLASLAVISVMSNFSNSNNNSRSVSNAVPTPIVVVNKVVNKVTKYITPMPSSTSINNEVTINKITQNMPQPTSAPAPACVVTIDGVKYDVSVFRNIHSGGDIFRCGSDVSNEFWGRHSQRQLNQMQKYRI